MRISYGRQINEPIYSFKGSIDIEVAAIVNSVRSDVLDLSYEYNVFQIKLLVDNLDDWIPGQYLNLINSAHIVRSYSIANIPAQDNYIELHITVVENGAMSQWLQETAIIDTRVSLRGKVTGDAKILVKGRI